MNRLEVTQQQRADYAIEKEEMRRLVAIIEFEMGIDDLDNQLNNHVSDVIDTLARSPEAKNLLERLVSKKAKKSS